MKTLRIVPFVLIVVSLFSCKPKVPGEYIQPDEFEDILYDFHLADGMANSKDANEDVSYDMTLYRQAVLRKYGITQAEFDSSLVYYMRHADRLHKVYENLTERFEKEAMALGASANDIRRYGDMSSKRDTSNLWRGVASAMLMPSAPYNVMSFEITADSTYRPGDKIIFSFNSDFVYKEGPKEAIALLAVQFMNDSVASNTVRISSSSNHSVTVSDFSRKGIKTIRGFVYLSDRKTARGVEGGENLRLMFINNIRMVRMRYAGDQDAPAVADQPKTVRRDTTSNKPVQQEAGSASSPIVPSKGIKPLDRGLKTSRPITTAPLNVSDTKPVTTRRNTSSH